MTSLKKIIVQKWKEKRNDVRFMIRRMRKFFLFFFPITILLGTGLYFLQHWYMGYYDDTRTDIEVKDSGWRKTTFDLSGVGDDKEIDISEPSTKTPQEADRDKGNGDSNSGGNEKPEEEITLLPAVAGQEESRELAVLPEMKKPKPVVRKKPVKVVRKKADPILALRPLLQQGMVLLLKNREKDRRQECVVYALIHAPYKAVRKALLDYDNLSKYIPHMTETRVISRKKNTIDVYYQIEIPGPNIHIKQRHTLRKNGVIETTPLDGVKGKWKWVPHEIDGGKKTIIAYHASTDITEQGWLLKKLLETQPAIREALNCSGALISMSALQKRFKRVVEKKSKLDIKALLPYLQKGTLSLIKDEKVQEMQPIITYSLINAPRKKVWAVSKDIESYPKFVPQLEGVKIIDINQAKGYTDIEFTVKVPLLRYSYVNRYEIGRYTMSINSIRRARGKYYWEFYKVGKQTLIRYSALADITNIGFWRRIVDKRPDLKNSLNLSVSQIVLRSIQEHSEKHWGNDKD